MSVVAGVGLSLALWRSAPRVGPVPGPVWAAGAGLAIFAPLLAVLPPAAAWLIAGFRRISRRRAEAIAAERDVVLLAELVGLSLSAGMALPGALAVAESEVAPLLGVEIARLRRAVAAEGAAAALGSAGGRAAGLYRLVARASATGAPVADAVTAFAAERRHAEHTRRLADARRLPVRLLVPLALLILPGFVVLAVGPAVLSSLARLTP